MEINLSFYFFSFYFPVDGITGLHAKDLTTRRCRGLHCNQGQSSCCSSADLALDTNGTIYCHQEFQWWCAIAATGGHVAVWFLVLTPSLKSPSSSHATPTLTTFCDSSPPREQWTAQHWQWTCQRGRRPSCTTHWSVSWWVVAGHLITNTDTFHINIVISYHQQHIPIHCSSMDYWQHNECVAVLPLQGHHPRLLVVVVNIALKWVPWAWNFCSTRVSLPHLSSLPGTYERLCLANLYQRTTAIMDKCTPCNERHTLLPGQYWPSNQTSHFSSGCRSWKLIGHGTPTATSQ